MAVTNEERPSQPPDDVSAPLDLEMAPLVEALHGEDRIIIKCWCWEHQKRPVYVDLAVEGLERLRLFVARINTRAREFKSEALFDIGLTWSEEVVTSCAFDLFPNWIMVSWSIERSRRTGAPSASLLAKLAITYRAAARAAASLSRLRDEIGPGSPWTEERRELAATLRLAQP